MTDEHGDTKLCHLCEDAGCDREANHECKGEHSCGGDEPLADEERGL